MNKKDWVEYVSRRTNLSPDILEKEYDNNFKEEKVILNNSYRMIEKEIPSTDFLNYVKNKCIVVENGVLFQNHNERMAITVKTLLTLTAERSFVKDQMLAAEAAGDWLTAKIKDGQQQNKKTSTNTRYGVGLNPASKFFNVDVSASTTARGRGTVSLNGLTLEMAFGSWRPYKIEAITDFIEKSRIKDVPKEILDRCPMPTEDMMLEHLLKVNKDTYYGLSVVKHILSNLTEDEYKKVYYTSNYKAFVKLPDIINATREILSIQNKAFLETLKLNPEDKEYSDMVKNIVYLDPMKPPKNIKDPMDVYAKYVKTLFAGYYWYEGDTDIYGEDYVAPEDIFRNIERESVALTDTDSLIFLVEYYVDMLIKTSDVEQLDTSNLDRKMVKYILGSMYIYLVSTIIAMSLDKYTTQACITENFRKYILYKQEFVFESLMTTKGAKNYLGIQVVREGKLLPKPKVDIKGLSLKKVNFNKYLAKRAEHIVIDMIAKVETPDVNAIFQEIKNVRDDVPVLFREKDNLDVFVVEKLKKGYKDIPTSDYRYKAVRLYNVLFDSEIPLPGAFLCCKLELLDDEESEIEKKYPLLYVKLLDVMKERTLDATIASMYTKIEKQWGEFQYAPELLKDIYNDAKEIKDPKELKKYISDTKKAYKKNLELDEDTRTIIGKLDFKNCKLSDIDRIALPLEAESVPEFISNHVDLADISVFENLISVVINGLGFEVIRNQSKRQIVHNIVSYY